MTDTDTLIAAPAGDVAAALDAAQDTAVVINDVGSAMVIARRDDVTIETVDTERFQAHPERHKGNVSAVTADGFIKATSLRAGDQTTLYVDPDACSLVAVIDDDINGQPEWRSHRVSLSLRPTPEWALWTGRQGLGAQAKFAETIEEGEAEIVEPSAAVMLELAQTFHASTAAKFRQAGRLADGRTQFVYEEDIDARAGETGEVSIPGEFFLALRPFHGAERYRVTARLRYRVKGGELTIGYLLHRTDDIRRTAFADVVQIVHDALPDLPLVEGVPAAER